MLSVFLADPVVSALFCPENLEVYTEYEVVNRFGDTRRIDRLLVGEDAVTVIDFKTSRAVDTSAALRQMAEYKELVAALFPGKKVTGKWAFVQEKVVQDV